MPKHFLLTLATKEQLPHIDRPLLRSYPTLTQQLPWISLANLPTPISHLKHLGKAFHARYLYIKDDGQTSKTVGGNKLRKLELLFADAISQGAKHIITFGCAGSNHATTTAFHAQQLGLSCSLLYVLNQIARSSETTYSLIILQVHKFFSTQQVNFDPKELFMNFCKEHKKTDSSPTSSVPVDRHL